MLTSLRAANIQVGRNVTAVRPRIITNSLVAYATNNHTSPVFGTSTHSDDRRILGDFHI